MTTIKATCPACGEVALTTDQVRLMVCSVVTRSYYAFDCTGCVGEVRKPADRQVVALLIAGGVSATSWRIPDEALECKSGPLIGYDDVLDFALRLRRADHLAAFARSAQDA
ncbi:MAG: hypothetical protein ABJA34_05395 [Pseudonocardiales bacterium]